MIHTATTPHSQLSAQVATEVSDDYVRLSVDFKYFDNIADLNRGFAAALTFAQAAE
ncbi:hypothetical protein [uncultured Methylovirgula sp.]|uniref:hypothetical protein n=1 Tax=uncultured Methylovirgula sp. TaxID=1285960 RepID=UPI00261BFC34|nr:hypothetical protein [uncultured Methylovirgula sp.]